jgi:hypothetical protein
MAMSDTKLSGVGLTIAGGREAAQLADADLAAVAAAVAAAVPTAAQIAAAILATPAQKLATDAGGNVTASSVTDKSGYSLATAPPTAVAIRQEIDANSTKLANAVPTAAQNGTAAAAAILAVPANKLTTDGSGNVAANNMLTPAAIDAELTSSHGGGVWGAGTNGAQVYTVTDVTTGAPIPGVMVRVTLDASGFQFIASGLTSPLGQFPFFHNQPSGTTVYIWREKTGCTFSNPDTETIP